MSRVPSIQWFGIVCGIALVGCSNATPPQPKPEPPKTVAVAPVAPPLDAASQTIERADLVRLSVLDQEAFANALIAPAKPNAALKRAFAKANKLLAA
jgi:hypothetical protein